MSCQNNAKCGSGREAKPAFSLALPEATSMCQRSLSLSLYRCRSKSWQRFQTPSTASCAVYHLLNERTAAPVLGVVGSNVDRGHCCGMPQKAASRWLEDTVSQIVYFIRCSLIFLVEPTACASSWARNGTCITAAAVTMPDPQPTEPPGHSILLYFSPLSGSVLISWVFCTEWLWAEMNRNGNLIMVRSELKSYSCQIASWSLLCYFLFH